MMKAVRFPYLTQVDFTSTGHACLEESHELEARVGFLSPGP